MRKIIAASTTPLLALVVGLLLLVPAPGIAGQARTRGGGGGHTSGGASGGGAKAAPRSEPRTAPAPSTPAAAPRSGAATGSTSGSSGARPRDGQPVASRAVPRGSVPPPLSFTTVVVPNRYYGGLWPWAFGGLGFGSYYGGFGSYYGFYDPFYAPFYGASLGYGGYGGYGGYAGVRTRGPLEGSLRLKVKPRDAQVFVDGLYVGIVDDFDGVFQRLHLDTGPHHVEVRATGYERLTFDVDIRFDETTKYEGELKREP